MGLGDIQVNFFLGVHRSCAEGNGICFVSLFPFSRFSLFAFLFGSMTVDFESKKIKFNGSHHVIPKKGQTNAFVLVRTKAQQNI
jgi:hypothetical protein